MHSNVLSTAVPIHSLPFWHSELLQLMSSSHCLLSSCTNASLGSPFLPKSANTDPAAPQVCKQIDTCSNAFKAQVDKHCKSLAPLYAGQPVAMYDTLHKIWIPATVVCILPKGSYQVHTSYGTIYHCMRQTPVWMQCQAHLTLSQIPQQPHCRLLPDLTSLCHSLHPLGLHSPCYPCLLYLQCQWLWSHRPQLFLPCQLSQRLPLHLCLQYPA